MLTSLEVRPQCINNQYINTHDAVRIGLPYSLRTPYYPWAYSLHLWADSCADVEHVMKTYVVRSLTSAPDSRSMQLRGRCSSLKLGYRIRPASSGVWEGERRQAHRPYYY